MKALIVKMGIPHGIRIPQPLLNQCALEGKVELEVQNDSLVITAYWPVGMPLCRSIKGHNGLWEIRINLSNGRIARVFFCAHEGSMVLLHGFIKKSQKTPNHEMAVAVKRMKGLTL